MGGVAERRADMLHGPRKTAIQRVQVHIAVIDHIAANHSALIKMDIVQIIDQPRRIVEILRRAVAVFKRERVHDMHGRARSAVMHIGPGQMQVMARVAGIKRDIPRRNRQHVLYQRARKAYAPVAAQHRARSRHHRNTRRRRLAEPDFLQRLQRCLVDLQHARIRQRAILPPGHPRTDGPHLIRQRGCAQGNTRPSPTGPAGPRWLAHFSQIAHRFALMLRFIQFTRGLHSRMRADWGSYIGARLASAA